MTSIQEKLDIPEGDLVIYYIGGSGGFFLYYLLLLTGQYVSGDHFYLVSNHIIPSVKFRINCQFPKVLKTVSESWKHFEYFPDNDLLASISTEKRKLYLVCNPLDQDEINPYLKNLKSVVLYTDYDLHLRLAYEKNSNFFMKDRNGSYLGHENEVKNKFKYIKNIKKQYTYYNGTKVHKSFSKLIDNVNPYCTVKLENIIKNKSLFNKDQIEFIEYWVGLHSPKIQRMLNETIDS